MSQCTAKSKQTGNRCRRGAIRGGMVCKHHGGAAKQVKAKAQQRLEEYVAKHVDPTRVLAEMARIAMSDSTALFDDRGKLKPMKDWTEEARAAVASFETVRRNVDSGDGHTDDVLKVKVWDKPKALEMLGKHLGLMVEKVEHKGEITVKWENE